MNYEMLLNTLRGSAEEDYRKFHTKLLKNADICVIGVKIPILRKLAKEYAGEFSSIMDFPDSYFEVTYLKFAMAAALPYGEFLKALPALLPKLDNWATCDCFLAPCIRENREDFLPHLQCLLLDEREFVKRYALVTLLHDYIGREYLQTIFGVLSGLRGEKYYVTMAAAWLLAEILVRFYEDGVEFLKEGTLDREILSRGVQKARESFRLSDAQKEELKIIKKQILAKKG